MNSTSIVNGSRRVQIDERWVVGLSRVNAQIRKSTLVESRFANMRTVRFACCGVEQTIHFTFSPRVDQTPSGNHDSFIPFCSNPRTFDIRLSTLDYITLLPFWDLYSSCCTSTT